VNDVKQLRVLIVRVGAMGDVLHGLPAVAALRKALPDCFIGWAIEPRWRPLLQAENATARGREMPIVDLVHLARTREWKERPFSIATLRQIAALRREMRDEHYDICVDLQGSIRSAVIGRMSGAPRFTGPREPRERQAGLLYRERVDVRAANVIDQACELLSAGIGFELTPASVTLPVDIEAEVWADYLLHQTKSPTALIVPTAGWGAKEWGVASHSKLAADLSRAGMKILVNASATNEDAAREIAKSGGGIAAATSLPQLIALTRRVSLVIGGDTGPVHLAAALGRPVVALFGPTDPARNGPYFPGANVQILRDPTSRTDHKRHAATEAGLAKITVEDVTAAALRIKL
jgi:heptosyltransferase-1